MEDVSNEKIYIELLKIKKLLHQSLDLQREIASIEEEIKLFEGRQAEDEDKIAAAVKKKKFASVIEWKNAVWEMCPHKEDHITEKIVSFYCKLVQGPCRFEICPRNVLED